MWSNRTLQGGAILYLNLFNNMIKDSKCGGKFVETSGVDLFL